MTTAFVDALADAEAKKEFTGYLAEVGELQRREDIRSDLAGWYGNLRFGESPSREELQALVDTTENIFSRCEAMLALAMYDLENGNIEQAVKQARELEAIYPTVNRHWAMGETATFFSTLATTLIKEGKYEEGIDYLVEGARNFGGPASWRTSQSREPFILPPLLALHAAIQEDDQASGIIRKKLQTSLESVKTNQAIVQSLPLLAIIETQIALGFEGDAIPTLKTANLLEIFGTELAKFQLRCGLFDEAIETYSQMTFRDRTDMSGRAGTDDRTGFLRQLFEMSLARNRLDHAEKIVELVRVAEVKPFMLIALAQAYQQSGNGEKALEIIASLGPPPAVRVVLVSGWSSPPPAPETHRAIGYFVLLEDLLADKASREQNEKQIETVLDKYLTEVAGFNESNSHVYYSALVSLLYWNDMQESAMEIIDGIDLPHLAVSLLLNIVIDHEVHENARIQRRLTNFQEMLPRLYPDYYQDWQLITEEYSSPNHFLDIATAIKSAEVIVRRVEERTTEQRARWTQPFEPDTAAMRTLLNQALTVIEKENRPLHRASILGAIGKMEYIYLSKEDAQKRFNEALELLKTAEVEPGTSVANQLALIFTELGDREKALLAIKITLFGNDSMGEIDTSQAFLERFRGNPLFLELLAQNGEAELAAALFLLIYDPRRENWRLSQLSTLQVIALWHDSQNPANLMLPKAQEQYQELFCQSVRAINHTQGDYNKESALNNLLLAWSASENRFRTMQAEIAGERESPGISSQYLARRRGGWESPLFGEFGLPTGGGGGFGGGM